MKLSELDVAPYNPREISEAAMKGLQESLAALGMLEVPVVNVAEKKKRLVSGHQRVKALIAEGYEVADCVIVVWTEEQEKMANLAMNNTSIQGRWDLKAALPDAKALAAQIKSPDYMGLESLHKEVKKLAGLNPALRESSKKHEKDEEAKTVPGIYRLGKHVLSCHDGTNSSNVSNAFSWAREELDDDGAMIQACITDPPYNVAYGTWKLGADKKAELGEEPGKLKNDNMSKDEWDMFLAKFCYAVVKWGLVKGPSYVFMSSKEMPNLERHWKANEGQVYRWLAWVKDQPHVSSFRSADYNSQYEWIMYGGPNTLAVPIPKKARTNIFSHKMPSNNKLHLTQKPMALITELVEDATEEGDVVLDPFAGSGTTLIACEILDRICVALEIDPHHADTIRRRWAEHVHGEGCDWEDLTPCLVAA